MAPTIDEIAVSASPGEIRAAFLSQGTLIRLLFDRAGQGPRLGDVFLGRVGEVARGIDTAFVSLGQDRVGVLPLSAGPSRNPGAGGDRRPRPSQGDAVVVQVTRRPQGTKGAKLTIRPRLAGRSLVLQPEGAAVVEPDPQCAATEAIRQRAAELADQLAEHGGTWHLQTRALDADDATILDEAKTLRARWHDLAERRRQAPCPSLLMPGPDPILAAVHAEASPALVRLVVDDARMGRRLAAAFPELAPSIEASAGDGFAALGIDNQVEAALAPVVPLPGGGRIIISPTESVIAVDVDTGAAGGGRAGGGGRGGVGGDRERTALAVNLEAADAIVRQVRLRDLGGHFVFDFVSMRRREHGHRVLQRLRDGFADDGSDTDVAGFTRLGLVEMTRRRRGPSLVESLLGPCSACGGHGLVKSAATVALAALRAALAEDRARPGRPLTLRAPPPVIAVLRADLASALAETAQRLGRPLHLAPDDALPPDRFDVIEGGRRNGTRP